MKMNHMLENRVVELTAELVRIPSVLGNESLVAVHAAQEMKNTGYDSVEVDSLGNVIGVIKGDLPGPTILLDAHMDTVDVHPQSEWSRDPFSGEIFNHRIYGRGTTDMKGALAAMICAAGHMDRQKLAGSAVIVGSVGEESTEGTALKSVIYRMKPDFVIIGEASQLRLVRAGRGRAEFMLEVKGVPCHASTPHRGVSAVLEMQKAVSAIEDLKMPIHPFVGQGVMCLTDIISTPYPAQSVVPSLCQATYERRLIPGETEMGVIQELNDACNQAGVRDFQLELTVSHYQTETGITLEEKKWYPAWELKQNDPFLLQVEKGLESTGIEPIHSSYQFCTNAAYTIGRAGISTIGFGPSSEKLAHIPDEYIDISQLHGALKGYRAMIEFLLTDHNSS